ncbi:NADAR domain-containing protein, partial [Omnitrophica bacterium]|nr:NADAR domain-containing protein [Candidatus Omnitrophota bacterium]
MTTVNSNISTHVSYTKPKIKIYKNDKGKKVTPYKIKLQFKSEEIPVIIALGEIRREYSGKFNILYCPVYIVLGDNIKALSFQQIGVYEFFAASEEQLKHNDGDFDIRLIEGPLLYDEFDSKKIKKLLNDKPLLKDMDEREMEEAEKASEIKEMNVKTGEKMAIAAKPLLISLEIEDDDTVVHKDEYNEKEYRKIVKDYEAMGVNAPKKNWLQKKFHDFNYKIHPNSGKGDCFFISLAQAYKYIGRKVTAKEIREKLATNIPEKTYKEYEERYSMFNNFLQKNKKSQEDILKRFNELKKMKKNKETQFDDVRKSIGQKALKKDPRYKEIKAIRDKMQQMSEEYKSKKDEFKETTVNLTDVDFMKDVKNLEQFKDIIRTSDYWADDSSIRILEEVLNIKIIVIDKNNRKGLIHCIDASDSIKAKGFFKPKYYIIADLDSKHYQLVSYKNRKMFRFHELPHSIKEEIKHACLINSGQGIYNFIPKFNGLIKKVDDDDDEDQDSKISTIDATAEEEDNKDFKDYNENIVFTFYSKSKDAKPGKGTNEKIPKDKEDGFKELNKIKDWRRVLSNFYIVSQPFELDGHMWNSVEHYYQACKFKNYTEGSEKHDFYLKFTAESNSEVSKDPAKAKSYGGKDTNHKYRPKHILMDDDFFNGNHKIAMEKGQRAKYMNDGRSQKVLLLTKNAKLVHTEIVRGKASRLVTFFDTMKIRKELN